MTLAVLIGLVWEQWPVALTQAYRSVEPWFGGEHAAQVHSGTVVMANSAPEALRRRLEATMRSFEDGIASVFTARLRRMRADQVSRRHTSANAGAARAITARAVSWGSCDRPGMRRPLFPSKTPLQATCSRMQTDIPSHAPIFCNRSHFAAPNPLCTRSRSRAAVAVSQPLHFAFALGPHHFQELTS